MIAENMKVVQKKIEAACEKSGRSKEEVTLIAVSKTKPVSMLQEAYDAPPLRQGALRPQGESYQGEDA